MPPKNINEKKIILFYPNANLDIAPITLNYKIVKNVSLNVLNVLSVVDHFVFTSTDNNSELIIKKIYDFFKNLGKHINPCCHLRNNKLLVFTFPDTRVLFYFYGTKKMFELKDDNNDVLQSLLRKTIVVWQQDVCPDPDNLNNVPGGEIAYYFSLFPKATTFILQFKGGKDCKCYKNSCFYCQALNFVREDRVLDCDFQD